jgi:hypothetical protein
MFHRKIDVDLTKAFIATQVAHGKDIHGTQFEIFWALIQRKGQGLVLGNFGVSVT